MFKFNNKYFTPCSTVSVINFEHVIAGWELKKTYLESFKTYAGTKYQFLKNQAQKILSNSYSEGG